MKNVLFIFTLLSFYSNAETNIVESFTFYTVSPTSKSNLLKALNSASPIKEKGNVYHGHTKYNINWRFWWQSTNNQCAFTKVETTLKLIYTMPQLESSKPDVKAVWAKWYPNLENHEKGHGKLAKDVAHQIDEKLLSIGPKASCHILEAAGNALAHKLMARLKAENIKYDNKTNHGETQKAWLYTHL